MTSDRKIIKRRIIRDRNTYKLLPKVCQECKRREPDSIIYFPGVEGPGNFYYRYNIHEGIKEGSSIFTKENGRVYYWSKTGSWDMNYKVCVTCSKCKDKVVTMNKIELMLRTGRELREYGPSEGE